MNKLFHKTGEALERGGHQITEAMTRDPVKYEVKRANHLAKEEGHAVAHRTEEGMIKAVDMSTNTTPHMTVGQRLDHAVDSINRKMF